VLAELFRYLHVHLVIGEPERNLGYLRREFLNFDAVELVNIYLHKLEDVQMLLAGRSRGAKDFEFEQSQFTICDNEEVPTPAGRVEELQPGQLLVKFKKLVRAS